MMRYTPKPMRMTTTAILNSLQWNYRTGDNRYQNYRRNGDDMARRDGQQ